MSAGNGKGKISDPSTVASGLCSSSTELLLLTAWWISNSHHKERMGTSDVSSLKCTRVDVAFMPQSSQQICHGPLGTVVCLQPKALSDS